MIESKRKPSEVLDRLFLGGLFDANRKEILQSLGIKYILIVGTNLQANFPNDFIYQSIEIDDEPHVNIDKYFEFSFKFIQEGISKGGCFVHCAFGASRSASLVIAYLMKEFKWKFKEAYLYLKSTRNVISPNSGFVTQLRNFEVTLGLTTKEELIKDLSVNPYIRDMKYV